jgi:peroxiredoxin
MAWGAKKTLETGAIAPQVSFYDQAGTAHTLDALLASGPIVLAFFKVSCPTCQLTLPFLNRLSGGETRIFAVSQDSPEAASEFAASFGVELPFLYNRASDGYPVSDAFRLTHVPTLFLVQPGRKIAWDSVGFEKRRLVALAASLGREIFFSGDIVPEMKAG